MSLVAYIVAGVLFVLAALNATPGGSDAFDLLALGLAALALAHVLPANVGIPTRLRRGE